MQENKLMLCGGSGGSSGESVYACVCARACKERDDASKVLTSSLFLCKRFALSRTSRQTHQQTPFPFPFPLSPLPSPSPPLSSPPFVLPS